MRNISKEIVPGAMRVLANTTPILALFIFAKISSVEELGNLNYFIALVTIIGVFTDFGIPEAVQRFVPRSEKPARIIFQTLLFELSIVIATAFVVLAADLLLHGAITKGYSLLVFLSILFSASNAIILCFNGLRNKFKVGLYYFGTAFSFVVLIYYFYEFWGKSPAESFLLARIASWALFVIIPILDLYISDHIDFHFSVPKRFAIFAANNAIIAFSISIFTEWDSIVVHSLGGERINGIYKSIDFLALAPNIIGTVITTQLLPQYSRMDANKSYQKMQKHFLKLTNYFLMLTPIIVLLSLVISKQLIKFVFTQEIADEGWHMFPVIILGSMFYVSVVPASSVLQASGKEKVLRNLLIIITTTFAVFSIICFKIFGVYGVIFLAVLLAIVFWISVFTRTRKFLNQKIALAQQKI